ITIGAISAACRASRPANRPAAPPTTRSCRTRRAARSRRSSDDARLDEGGDVTRAVADLAEHRLGVLPQSGDERLGCGGGGREAKGRIEHAKNAAAVLHLGE